MQWIDDDTEEVVNTPPTGAFGFVYCITYTDGCKYIGKKQFFKKVTLPALKSGEQRPNSLRIAKNRNGKRVYFDVLQKESNWQNYKGSTELSFNKTIKEKRIMEYAASKTHLTYLECKYILGLGCLEDDEYLNENCLGKFYKGNLGAYKEQE